MDLDKRAAGSSGLTLDDAQAGDGPSLNAAGAEGIVTLADERFFVGLVLLYLSVQENYPVPIVCFDGGLSARQKRWAGENMPLCSIRPIPDTDEIEQVRQSLGGTSVNQTEEWLLWVCPLLIAASPFRRTLWLDSDLIVLRRLGELFQKIEGGPVFTSENHAPGDTANPEELYALLPIEQPFDRQIPLVNGGVTGWDLERDAELLAMYRHPVLEAARDERIRQAIKWHDQGSLIWAIQKTGMEQHVVNGREWNLCAEHTATPLKEYSFHGSLFEELREDYPQANIVHWNGFPREEKLHGRLGDEDTLLDAARQRLPGRERQTGFAGGGQRIHLVCYLGAKATPRLVDRFLDHYARLGVDSMLIVLQGCEDDPRLRVTLGILRRYGIAPVLVTPEFSALLKHRRCSRIMDEHCRADDWVLLADVDEFQVYPGPLPDILRTCDTHGHEFVKGQFVDRIAEDLRLRPIREQPSLWEQFPLGASATAQISGGWTHKVCAMKGWLRPGDGGSHALDYGVDGYRNYCATHRDPRSLPGHVEIHHFKWDATLVQRTREKVAGDGGDRDALDGPEFMHEYRRLLHHLERNGRLNVVNVRLVGIPPLHYIRDSLPAADPFAVPSADGESL